MLFFVLYVSSKTCWLSSRFLSKRNLELGTWSSKFLFWNRNEFLGTSSFFLPGTGTWNSFLLERNLPSPGHNYDQTNVLCGSFCLIAVGWCFAYLNQNVQVLKQEKRFMSDSPKSLCKLVCECYWTKLEASPTECRKVERREL